MKRKFILLPITLTALTPAISLVGCKDSDEPKVITHTVTFSAGEHGSLEGEATVIVKGDKTTLGEITKPTINEDEGWDFTQWNYDDSYVINDDVTITALYIPGEVELANRTQIAYSEGGEYYSLVHYHSNKLNFPADSTFNFIINFSKWDITLPYELQFRHWENEKLVESNIPFSLNKIFINETTPVDPSWYEDTGTKIQLNNSFTQFIKDYKPTITGEITLEDDVTDDFLCFTERMD